VGLFRKSRLAALASLAIAGSVVAVGVQGGTGSAATPVIQPGSSLEFGNSFCTMNWVYDGSGGPYVGAAGHCTTGVGQEVDLASGSLGTPIERIGSVVFASVSPNLDYCLIRVDAAVASQLNASMAGHPTIPTGVSTRSTAKQGDVVQFSGHGVGADSTTVTQQDRVGVFNFFDSGNQYVIGPVTPGDSGGPVADVTDGNKAVGIVDTVGLTIVSPNINVGEGGVALYALLADAAAHGFTITLRTV
jgi:hypothetical protein